MAVLKRIIERAPTKPKLRARLDCITVIIVNIAMPYIGKTRAKSILFVVVCENFK
jgi:hypothetical protein